MPTSEARIRANRENSLKSCGPKTPEGKAASRRNGLKHGMTGRGIVVLDVDAAEVERRNEGLLAEMAPRSMMGAILVRQLATLSVRMERGAREEFAQVAERVRHAEDDHESGLVDRAEALLATLGDDPRTALRQLKRFPEGIMALLETWQGLKEDLKGGSRPQWDASRMKRMADLMALPGVDRRRARIEALSRASWGYFVGLTEDDGAGLADEARKVWAQERLLEIMAGEIAALGTEYEALDLEAFELDHEEAADRALFDDSKKATLARRYESEARRGFFKALKEFRQVEAEVDAEAELAPPAPDPELVPEPAPLASARGEALRPTPATVELAPPPLWPPSSAFAKDNGVVFEADGGPLMDIKTARGPAR